MLNSDLRWMSKNITTVWVPNTSVEICRIQSVDKHKITTKKGFYMILSQSQNTRYYSNMLGGILIGIYRNICKGNITVILYARFLQIEIF